MVSGMGKDENTICLVIDIETTGLNEGDEIIKFSGILFELNDSSGEVIEILDQYQGKKERGLNLSTEQDLENQEQLKEPEFSNERIQAMINKADIIITHNIQLVSRFICSVFPEANQKEWFETMEGFPWTPEGFPSKTLDEIVQDLDFEIESTAPIFNDFREFWGKASSVLNQGLDKIKVKDWLNSLLQNKGEEKPQERNLVQPENTLKQRKGIEFKGAIDPNPIRKYDVLGPSSENFQQKEYKARVITKPKNEFPQKRRAPQKKKSLEKLEPKHVALFGGVGLLLIVFLVFSPFNNDAPDENQTSVVPGTDSERREEVHLSREEEQGYFNEEMLIGLPQVVINFREGPDTSYDIKRQLRPEDSFFVTGEQENWFYVVLIGPDLEERGWIHKDYVDVLLYSPEQDFVGIHHIGSGAEERDVLHLGMNQEVVRDVLGEPEMAGDKIWYYRGAPVYFNEEEKVIGWENRNDGLSVNLPTRGFTGNELREIFEDKFKTLVEGR